MRIMLLLALMLSAAVQAQTTYLIADRMIDVLEGEVITNPLITIEGDRISSVSRGGIEAVPTGAQLVDLRGHTLTPGLIDMHVHLVGDTRLNGYNALGESTGRALLSGVMHAETTLLTGVTTVRNVGAPAYKDVDLRDAIARGDIPGPRMFVSGPSLGATGGHCDNNYLPFEWGISSEGVADGPWALREKVRQNVKYGADVIKFCATGGVFSKGTKIGVQQFTLEEMQAIVDEAHRHGMIVAAHAHGTDGIRTAIEAGVDSVEHASLIDDEGIRLARRNGTYLSMDIYVTEYILGEGEAAGMLPEALEKERTVGGAQRESFTEAVDRDVKMVFGTDAGVYPHGRNTMQLSRMLQFGMQPMEVFQAATINAATLLRQQDNFGAIAPGLLADIIAVPGNPMDNMELMEQVVFVMKEGLVYKTP